MRNTLNRGAASITFVAFLVAVSVVFANIENNKAYGASSDKSSKKIVVKLSYCTSLETPKGKASTKFADLVHKRAGDRIEVQVFPSSQLYGDKEEVQALMANNAQIILPSITKLVSMNPSYQVVDLPFLFPNDKAVYKFWDGKGGQILLRKLEKQGLLGLAAWNNAPINIIGKKLFKTPQDFKGVKIRIPAGQVTTDVFNALGAGATTISFSEVYTSLQQGVVDAAISSINNFDTEKYYEVAKYLTVIDLQRIEYIALTNTTFWNGLSEDVKKILTECMNEAAKYERGIADELNQHSLQVMKSSGVQVYTMTDKEKKVLEDLFVPVYKKWIPRIGEDLVTLAKEAGK